MHLDADFTPSRGSTPVHHSFSAGPPRLDKTHFDAKTPGSEPPPSPKKRLSELFRESFQKNKEVGEQNIISNQNGVNGKTEAKSPKFGLPPRSANSNHFASGANSVCSNERTPTIGYYVIEKEEPMGSMRCCIPRVLSSRGFSGRKIPPRSIGWVSNFDYGISKKCTWNFYNARTQRSFRVSLKFEMSSLCKENSVCTTEIFASNNL